MHLSLLQNKSIKDFLICYLWHNYTHYEKLYFPKQLLFLFRHNGTSWFLLQKNEVSKASHKIAHYKCGNQLFRKIKPH